MHGNYFSSPEEAIMAYENKEVGMHAKIFVRMSKIDEEGNERHKKVETTVGRIIFNKGIPQDLGFVDRSNPENEFEPEINFVTNKKMLGKIVGKCIDKHGLSRTAELLDYIKSSGFKHSTTSGITVSIEDAKVPEEKKTILLTLQRLKVLQPMQILLRLDLCKRFSDNDFKETHSRYFYA